MKLRTVRIGEHDLGPGRHLPAHPHRPHQRALGVAFSPDGRLLATTGGDDATARLWDRVTGKCLSTLTGHDGHVLGAAFSPDGRLLATASSDETARLWD